MSRIQKLEGAGVEAVGGSAEQLAAALAGESKRVMDAAKRADLRAE